MMPKANDGRHFMASVKIGPKGQIVIPKEVREMFGFEPGDSLVLLADTKRGVALQTEDKLKPFMRKMFDSMQDMGGDDE